MEIKTCDNCDNKNCFLTIKPCYNFFMWYKEKNHDR